MAQSEQIDELREIADWFRLRGDPDNAKFIDQAADTIATTQRFAEARLSDASIEKLMEWPSGAMKNIEVFDMAYRVRLVSDAASKSGAFAAAAAVGSLREVLARIAPGSLASEVRERAEEAIRAATPE